MHSVNFLIIDSDDSTLNSVQSIIEEKIGSDNIFTASNPLIAIKLLELERVDIIIADWDNLHTNEDHLLHYIRENNKFEKIPIIMMTSQDEANFIINTIKSGITQYLITPFTSDELEDKILKSWNSAKKRKAERHFKLPDHQVKVKINNDTIFAKVINISSTGILLQLECNENLNLFGECTISLAIEKTQKLNTCEISSIKGTIIRLEASKAASKLCKAAVIFETDMNPKTEIDLNAFLNFLASRHEKVIK